MASQGLSSEEQALDNIFAEGSDDDDIDHYATQSDEENDSDSDLHVYFDQGNDSEEGSDVTDRLSPDQTCRNTNVFDVSTGNDDIDSDNGGGALKDIIKIEIDVAMSDSDQDMTDLGLDASVHPPIPSTTVINVPKDERNSDDTVADNEQWTENTKSFPQIPPFTGMPGLKVDLGENPQPYDVYKLIITDDVINSWKVETNRYASQMINAKKATDNNISPRSKFSTWEPVTHAEICAFIAICMHMGLVKKPTLHDYWSRHPALHTSFCTKIMTRDRFLHILTFFHISNNATFVPYGQEGHDPIQKIRPFVSHLQDIFKKLYVPTQNICMDEAMCPFKGRSRFKVYMKDKPTKWGFKFYELRESKSGYVYNFEMFCNDKRLSNKPVDVVMRLMEPLFNQGYKLYADSYYTCPDLCNQLLTKNTMLCGTVRKNCSGMPPELFAFHQSKGELAYRRKGKVIITRWTDKREVVTLSTIHKPEMLLIQERFEEKKKPISMISYITNMSGMDHSDQLFSFFPMRRKSQKWWKKPFFHLLTLVSVQTSILLNKHRQSKCQKRLPLADVVKEIILHLAAEFAVVEPPQTAAQGPSLAVDRLLGKHFPTWCPETTLASKGKARRGCKVCSAKAIKAGVLTAKERKNKKVLTRYWCEKCKVPLCLECFEPYHTKQDYTK